MSQDIGSLQTASGLINPVQILYDDIKTAQVDKNFELILAEFRTNGTATKFGVALLTTLPSSRPRSHDSKVKYEVPTSLAVIKTTVSAEYIGVYKLKETKTEEKVTWISRVDRPGTAAPVITTGGILAVLEGFIAVGDLVKGLEGTGSTRVLLGLKRYPFILPRLPDSLDSSPGHKHLNSSFIDVHTAGSLVCLHTPIAGLTQVIYNHRGGPQLWIVVGPAENAKLELALLKRFDLELYDGKICPQSLDRLSIFVTPDTLRSWGIFFTQVIQLERQTLTIFGGSYFCGYSGGFAVLEKKFFAGPDWLSDKHRFCVPKISSCSAERIQVEGSGSVRLSKTRKRHRFVAEEQTVVDTPKVTSEQVSNLSMREVEREREMDRICNENSGLRSGIEQLAEERNGLLECVAQLRDENGQLLADNEQLFADNGQLFAENGRILAAYTQLNNENGQLRAENQRMQANYEQIRAIQSNNQQVFEPSMLDSQHLGTEETEQDSELDFSSDETTEA